MLAIPSRRPSRRAAVALALAATFIVAGNAGDVATTLVLLHLGGYEANPLCAAALAAGVPLFVAFKLAIAAVMAACCLVLAAALPPRLGRPALALGGAWACAPALVNLVTLVGLLLPHLHHLG